MKLLTMEERETLAKICKLHSLDRSLNFRGKQTTKEDKAWTLQGQEINGVKMFSPIRVSHELGEIYREAMNTEVKEDGLEVETLEKVINKIKENKQSFAFEEVEVEDWKEVSRESLKNSKVAQEYLGFFTFFEKYNSRPIDIKKVKYQKGDLTEIRLAITFSHPPFVWQLEVPYIRDNGFFSYKGNNYCFQYKPKNLSKYLLGTDDTLELFHPFQTLSYEILKVYTDKDNRDVMYKKEYFDDKVKFAHGKTIIYLQNKIDKFLRNAKEYVWEEKKLSPVVWLETGKSKITEYSFASTILTDLSYDTIVENGLIRGLDLLTGSTSLPGRRVKVSANFEITRENGKVIVKKVRNLGEKADFVCIDKLSYPSFELTSSKRQNSATMKDSNSLVHEFAGLPRRFSVKTK